MKPMERLVLALRVLMEVGVVAGAAAWGVHLGGSTASRVALGVVVPVVVFGIWGAVDFRQAGRFAEAGRLVEELVITVLVGVGWYFAGRPVLGSLLIAVSAVYHPLVYASGGRLLKGQRSIPPVGGPAASR